MFLPKFLVVGLCVVAGGCASAWQVPDSVTRAREGLNAASAEASVRKGVMGSNSANGLCGRITAGLSYPSFVDLRDGKLTFTDSYTRVAGSNARVTGAGVAVTTATVQERGNFMFDFKAVERVFIMAPVELGQCAKTAGNLPLMVKDAQGTMINVDLAPENYDTFLAAMMVLSPKARFTQGAGL